MAEKKKRLINVVTLGCSKNVVDSEHLMAQLHGNGFQLTYDSNSTDAQVVVINTCGFIGDAKEESINMILDFARAKTEGRIDHLFVMGCLSERYKEELRREIPEVDQLFGVNDLAKIVETVGGLYRPEVTPAPTTETAPETAATREAAPKTAATREAAPKTTPPAPAPEAGAPTPEPKRYLTTPDHYAYLKISEGCNWGCGYCAIPLIRGRHRSVPLEELLEEARQLAERGVRELIVIAQDTTYYGMDLYGERRLGTLLRRLCQIEGIEWVRLHYAYPTQFPEDVIAALRDEPKLCKYLDIPFQHISDGQLRSMRRGITQKEVYGLIRRLRREVPGITLRTTLLTGYPNETEADFEELLQFVREVHFERLGVFPYCEEEGTYSAIHLTDNVPQEVKQARAERIMELQNEISRELNAQRVGQLERVVIDRREGDFYVGRSQYDSPEVDTEILIHSPTPLAPGSFLTVRLSEAEDYDLYGEVEK